jgi:DNA-binding NarL/FixJ family response regulator
MLESIPGIEIQATAADGEEVLLKLKAYYIDILLLDIQMPKLNGMETAKLVFQKYPETKIISLSMHNERLFIQKMFESGAKGYLLKSCNKEELLSAIRKIHEGGTHFSDETTLALLQKDGDRRANKIVEEQLSKREREILMLIAREENNQSIAEQLHISIHTVNTHRKNLLFKLGVKNTAGLVRYAIMKNMLE